MTTGDQMARNMRMIRLRMRQLPGNFLRALKGKEGRIANKALARLTTEPGRPSYPLRWTTERQRRAYFATDGFGRGIPFRRKGTLLKRWQVEVLGTNEAKAVVLTNDSPVMQFVQGARAQGFHKDTGWVQVSEIEDMFYREAVPYVIDVWTEEANPFKGLS